jgi:hypothetical protein
VSRLTLVDRLTVAYLAVTLAVVAVRSERIPAAPGLVGPHPTHRLRVWLLARARAHGGVAGVLADWYPLLLFVLFFEQMGMLVHAFVDGWYDHLLIAIDRALLGVDATVWIERHANYWLTEVMQFAYTSYFPLTAGVATYLWFRHGRAAFAQLMLASCIAYYTCYVIFIVFPIESPFHTLRHLQQVELHGGFFTRVIEWIERYGRVHGGAFPSAPWLARS